jgi:hypothetical protein
MNFKDDDEVVMRFVEVPAIGPPSKEREYVSRLKFPLVSVSVFAILQLDPRVTPFPLSIITPPVPPKVLSPPASSPHSGPVICDEEPLYCSVAFEPAVMASDAVAVPSIDKMPLTETVAVVFSPDPERIRLL